MLKSFPGVLLIVMTGAALLLSLHPLRADHSCDDLGEAGWSTVASHETVNVADSAPYQAGTSGDWFITRTTTVLPLCNYINAAGNYSLRSYSLSPEEKTERVAICRGGVAVAPYSGQCPPR
jgi:hypothetical protein